MELKKELPEILCRTPRCLADIEKEAGGRHTTMKQQKGILILWENHYT